MKIYLSKTHSDEEGEIAEEGKLGIIYGKKEQLLKLCDFFKQVEEHLKTNNNCHMHLRDSLENWNSKSDIDLEINLEK